MRGRGHWQWPVGLGVVATLVSCDLGPGTAVIYVSSSPRTARIASEALAARRGRGDPEIQVMARPEGDLPQTVRTAEFMVADDAVMGVVGPSGSGDALLAAPVFARAGVVQVLPTANAPGLETAGPWTFMLAPRLEDEARTLANLATETRVPSRLTVFYSTDPYGRALAAELALALAAGGAASVERTPLPAQSPCRDSIGAPELGALVAEALTRTRPELVLVAGRTPEAACIISTLRGAGDTSPVILSDGAPLAATLGMLRTAPGTVRAVTFWVPGRSDHSRVFEAAFRSAVGREPSVEDAYAYDAIMLIGTAIQAVGMNRDAIRRWLTDLGRDGRPFEGVTGPITFPVDPTGRLLVLP